MTHAALPWRDRAELWLAGGLKRYFQWFARTAEPGVDTAAQEYLFGSRRPDERDRAHNARAIPPIVWAYWSGAAGFCGPRDSCAGLARSVQDPRCPALA